MNQPSALSNSATLASNSFAARSGVSTPYSPASASEPNAPGSRASGQTPSPEQETPEAGPKVARRCAHLFPSGRRCRRLPSVANACFCSRHAALTENRQPSDLSPEFTEDWTDLDTFDGMHDFLAKLALLLVKDRVSTRRASVLAFITGQLIRTLSAIHREEDSAGTQIIFDAPRPSRD